jgi:hypothetical protein
MRNGRVLGSVALACLSALSASFLLVGTGCSGTADTGQANADSGGGGDDSGDGVDAGGAGDGGNVRTDAGRTQDGGATRDGGGTTDSGTAIDSGGTQTYPAAHPPMPVLQNNGGPVLAHPKITTVTFPGDTMASTLEAFGAGIGATPYWSAATAEYGVGAATAGTPVHLTESAPANIDDAAIQTWLAGKLDGTHAEFGVPTANSLYAIYYPSTTTVTLQGITSCTQFGGYHNSIVLGAQQIAYAIMPRCNWNGQGELDTTTGSASHEFLEAATDPLPLTSTPAYTGVDADHAVWEMILLGEDGDLCAQFQDSFYKPSGFNYSVQRSWSNASAAAGHDPCAPSLAGEVYFNAAPVLNDTVSFNFQGQSGQTKGVSIPVGQSKTIDLDLYSDAAIGAWALQASDLQSNTLKFAFSQSSGSNGDKVKLTITVLQANAQYGGEPFAIVSTKAGVKHYWFGFVGN